MTAQASRPATRDIGFVLQGSVGPAEHAQLLTSIAKLRCLAPDSQIILSTWESCANLASDLEVDALVLSADPGALHGIRVSGESHNNVNRQIGSTRAGLDRCERPYAVKLRVDAGLTSLEFLDLFAQFRRLDAADRIVVPMLFTLDPTMFEQVPMHISDWFQFGSTKTLRDYWNCPFMTPEESVWYGNHPYAAHSTHLDRRFFCLFAVEQHLARHYAQNLGFAVPQYHNDIRPAVLQAHNDLLARHFIVADLNQIGLEFPKYAWAARSDFQKLNCVSYLDWLDLAAKHTGLTLTDQQRTIMTARQKRKALARRLYRLAKPFWPALSNPALKTTVNFLLRRIVSRRA